MQEQAGQELRIVEKVFGEHLDEGEPEELTEEEAELAWELEAYRDGEVRCPQFTGFSRSKPAESLIALLDNLSRRLSVIEPQKFQNSCARACSGKRGVDARECDLFHSFPGRLCLDALLLADDRHHNSFDLRDTGHNRPVVPAQAIAVQLHKPVKNSADIINGKS